MGTLSGKDYLIQNSTWRIKIRGGSNVNVIRELIEATQLAVLIVGDGSKNSSDPAQPWWVELFQYRHYEMAFRSISNSYAESRTLMNGPLCETGDSAMVRQLKQFNVARLRFSAVNTRWRR
jgi:hypothetical protein